MFPIISVCYVAVGISSIGVGIFFGMCNVPADKHVCQTAYRGKTASTVLLIAPLPEGFPCSHTPTKQT